jgi:hypothetical protein
MRLKRSAIGNTLEEHIKNLGNILGTYWEADGNPLRTKKKRKKSRHFECMLSLPIGCMKFLIPELSVSIFGLG